MIEVKTDSPLEKLRNWRPTPVKKIHVVFEADSNFPIIAFHTREEAVEYCIYGTCDTFDEQIEWAQFHWEDYYEVRYCVLAEPMKFM